jgi:hypothetical protein
MPTAYMIKYMYSYYSYYTPQYVFVDMKNLPSFLIAYQSRCPFRLDWLVNISICPSIVSPSFSLYWVSSEAKFARQIQLHYYVTISSSRVFLPSALPFEVQQKNTVVALRAGNPPSRNTHLHADRGDTVAS